MNDRASITATNSEHKCPRCKAKTNTYIVERPSLRTEQKCDDVEKFRCTECGFEGYTAFTYPDANKPQPPARQFQEKPRRSPAKKERKR